MLPNFESNIFPYSHPLFDWGEQCIQCIASLPSAVYILILILFLWWGWQIWGMWPEEWGGPCGGIWRRPSRAAASGRRRCCPRSRTRQRWETQGTSSTPSPCSPCKHPSCSCTVSDRVRQQWRSLINNSSTAVLKFDDSSIASIMSMIIHNYKLHQ